MGNTEHGVMYSLFFLLLSSYFQEDMYRASAIRALCKITDVSSFRVFSLPN